MCDIKPLSPTTDPLKEPVTTNNPTDLTDYQIEALEEFKTLAKDILSPNHTDSILLKWLRTRNYNAKIAEMFFREMWSTKLMYDIDSLPESEAKPKVVQKYEYTSFIGFAKDHSVVRYSCFGTGDHLGLLMSVSLHSLIIYANYVIEEDMKLQRKENLKTGKDINEITYIFDMEGFSFQTILHKSILETALDLGHTVQDYQPEVWRNVFFINVPSYFDALYTLFKPILRNNLIQKIKVSTKESTPGILLKYIDEDVLPQFLGGKRVDSNGDPRCTEFVKFGGKIPEEYYLCHQPQLQPTDPGVTSLWVPARGYYNHCIVVTQANSRFNIEFRTEDGSINFRILYREQSEGGVPTTDEYLDERDLQHQIRLISPAVWMQTHLSPLNFECKAPWTGVYIFRFSNTHSLFYARRLYFRIKLIEPKS